MAKIVKNNITYTSVPSSASMLPYDNSDSGLDATNVQAAIDEVAEGGGGSSTFAGLSDVSLSDLQNGQVPKYNSQTQKWENANESGGDLSNYYTKSETNTLLNEKADTSDVPAVLGDLNNVNVATATNGQVLKYNGTNWVNANESGGGSTVTVTQIQSTGTKIATIGVDSVSTDLYSPVGVSSVSVTQVQSTGTKIATITVDSTSTDLYAPNGGGASSLTDLTDVTISSASDGQVLTYDNNSGDWVNESLPTIPDDISDLGDVTISSATNGQVLKYNGTKWVNANESTGSTVSVTQVQSTGTKIATITVDSVGTDLYAPNSSTPSASQISYDNTTSGLVATDVQDAIDEVVTDLGSKADASDVPEDIQDLDNVTITSATSGQILKYDGSGWINANESTGSTVSVTQVQSTGNKLATITVDSIATDIYSPTPPSPTSVVVTQTQSSGTKIGAISVNGTGTDLYAPDPTSVSVTQIQSTGTKIATITVNSIGTDLYAPNGGSASSLNDLTDVTITSGTLSQGQSLMYDGSDWVNDSLWKEVTGTLTAGSTSITLQDASITTSSTIDIYTDSDVDYNSVTVTTGQVVITFDAQQSNLGVKVRIS